MVVCAAILVGILLASAAFGSGVQTTEPAAETVKPVTLKVAHASPSPQHMAFWVAKAEGYFADERITVENVDLGGGPMVLQALVSGRVDVALFSIATAIQGWSLGKPVIVVAALGNRALQIPLVSTAWLRAKGYDPAQFTKLPVGERVKALKGARWPTTGAAGLNDSKVRVLAKLGGLDPDRDLQIIPFNNAGATVAALFKRGTFDVVFVEPPRDLELVDGGFAVRLLDTGNPDEVPEVGRALQSQVITEARWAEKNQPVVKRFVSAIARASAFIHSAKSERIAEGLHKEFPELSTPYLIQLVQAIIDIVPRDARLPNDVLEINIDLAMSGAANQRRPKVADIYTERYLPTSQERDVVP
jgi:NitT/TauT family transport system substrate-binding protein